MSRAALVAKIHVGKKQLGLDDDTYRDLLDRVTGRRSAKDCSEAQLAAIVAEMERLGFNAAQPRSAPEAFKKASKPQARLIFALWGELGARGALADPSKQGLRKFVAHQLELPSPTDPDFLAAAQFDPIISALRAWVQRAKSKSVPEGEAGQRARSQAPDGAPATEAK